MFTSSENLEKNSFPWPGHWIGGVWEREYTDFTESQSFNPSTQQVLMKFPITKVAFEQGVDAATKYFESRSSFSADSKSKTLATMADWIESNKTNLIRILKMECGKSHWDCVSEIDASIAHLNKMKDIQPEIYQALLAPATVGMTNSSFQLLPVGVSVAYIPFSAPLSTFVTYFAATVIADCPVLFAASTHVAVLSTFIAHGLESLDCPKGRFNLVISGFKSTRIALRDRRIAGVMFTGSRSQCDDIRNESKHILGRQLMLQSGGKNSVIVHSSADIDLAVKAIAIGSFRSAGQLCSSTSRIFVYENHYSELVSKFMDYFNQLKINDPLTHQDSFMGPLYSKKAVEKFLRFQTMAGREAVESVSRGSIVPGSAGHFVKPGVHVLPEFDISSAYQSNVLFCPDIAIYRYSNLDEVIGNINATDAAFSVSFIGDAKYLKNKVHEIKAPNVLVNLPTTETSVCLPLAGRLQSGHHRFNGFGLAMRLTYPQAIVEMQDSDKLMNNLLKN